MIYIPISYLIPCLKLFMIWTLYLILLPLVFSAAIKLNNSPKRNHFQSIIGTGIIQNDLVNFLQFKELIKLFHTCHDFCRILDGEYDVFLKELHVSNNSYNCCDDKIKYEIQKLYKYFKIEMSNRISIERFTFPLYYQIIDGTYFTHENVFQIIENDNFNALNSSSSYEITQKVNFRIPYFPEISLRLLKYQYNQYEIESLIINACKAPHLFDCFFKHLAKNVYGVTRDELVKKIEKDFSNSKHSEHLVRYTNFIKGAFGNVVAEILAVCLLPILMPFLLIAYNLNFYVQVTIWSTLFLGCQMFLNWKFLAKYENFEECDRSAVGRFCVFLKYLNNDALSFKWIEEDSL